MSGLGDLVVTCTSRHSRNRGVGERLGRGEPLSAIQAGMRQVAEGVWNSRVVHELASSLGVEMPICDTVYALCHKGFDARKAVEMMMGRELKAE